MKKFIIKIFSFITSFTLKSVLFFLSGCLVLVLMSFIILSYASKNNESSNEIQFYETDLYIYTLSNAKHEKEVIILGLTDKGKEQEFLIIPEKINGIKVGEIGCSYYEPFIAEIKEKYGRTDYALIQSENLKKVFLTSDIKIIIRSTWGVGGAIQNCPNFEGLFFISKKEYESVEEYNDLHFVENPANVSYFYNYENAPNDNYYWIDDYDYSEKIEFIPPEPTREGYIFDGWYKESECINKWDYDVDTLPQIQYDKNEKQVYQETKLYAKWIEQGG